MSTTLSFGNEVSCAAAVFSSVRLLKAILRNLGAFSLRRNDLATWQPLKSRIVSIGKSRFPTNSPLVKLLSPRMDSFCRERPTVLTIRAGDTTGHCMLNAFSLVKVFNGAVWASSNAAFEICRGLIWKNNSEIKPQGKQDSDSPSLNELSSVPET